MRFVVWLAGWSRMMGDCGGDGKGRLCMSRRLGVEEWESGDGCICWFASGWWVFGLVGRRYKGEEEKDTTKWKGPVVLKW